MTAFVAADFTRPINPPARLRLRHTKSGEIRTFEGWCNCGGTVARAFGMFPSAGRVWAEEYIRAGLLVPA